MIQHLEISLLTFNLDDLGTDYIQVLKYLVIIVKSYPNVFSIFFLLFSMFCLWMYLPIKYALEHKRKSEVFSNAASQPVSLEWRIEAICVRVVIERCLLSSKTFVGCLLRWL